MENTGRDNWPVRPYKGLSSYGPEDAPLFAGRTADVELCAEVLASRSTRIIILQGDTGCGKTSFLRAGLIPYLETDANRFEFIKDKDEPNFKALFIRSTENPLVMMAQAIYEFAAKDIPLNSFLGEQTLELSRTVADYKTSTEFLRAVSEQPAVLVRTLGDIAEVLPKTLVLVLDQAEESLTINQQAEGDSYRKRFFDFVSLFSETQFDLKLIFTFRTEFYGRFIDECKLNPQSRTVSQYRLKELTDSQLIEAIKRPTSTETIPGFGKPFDRYRFSYETGLPEEIVTDLKNIVTAGAKLSLLQLTCDNLYGFVDTDSDTERPITRAEYNNLGGIEGQLESNIDRAVRILWGERSNRWRHNLIKETAKWKDVLADLAKEQVGGAITTEIVSEDHLRQRVRRARCFLPFRDVVDYFSSDSVRIMRRISVIDIRNGDTVSAFSLGHDAVGLALRTWTTKSKQAKTEARRRLAMWALSGIAFLIISGFLYGFLYLVSSPALLSRFLIVMAAVTVVLVIGVVVASVLALLAYFGSERASPRDDQHKSLLSTGYLQDFRINFWWLGVRSAIPLAAALVGLCQTSYFGRFLPGYDHTAILDHISSCRALQKRDLKEGQTGISFESFEPELERRLQAVVASFLDDPTLNQRLKSRFSRDFRDLDAVVVPSWEVISRQRADLYGITLAGWSHANKARNADYVGAYTLRNRPDEPAVTSDGRPRIILNPSAFQSESALRFTLFHELLHALDIPGADPPWFCFGQDDLRYLKEYRDEVDRRGWIAPNQVAIWVLAVLLPLGIANAQIIYAYAYWKARGQSHR